MGVFSIHSRGGLSSITCSMMENIALNYQVLPTQVDPSYDERMKVIYSETATGGSPSGLKTGLVQFKFRMFISGANQAAVISNIATVTRVLTHPDGGYIEYRPIGLGDSVMETWYRFVQSGVPKMVRKEGLIDTIMERYNYDMEEQVDGALIDCEVETFAWGTSDPYYLYTIMAQTSVDNNYDGSNNNTFTVASASVKGDAIVPIFTIKGGNVGGVTDVGSIILHKRQIAAGGAVDHLDWREGETHLSGWNTTPDAANSNGNYAYVTGDDSGDTFGWASDTPDRYMLGKVSPIVLMRLAAADDNYTIYLKSVLSSIDAIQQSTDEIRVEDLVQTWRAYSFSTLDLPPASMPEWIDHGTNINLEDFFGGLVEIVVDADDAGDQIRVDFAWFPKVDGGNYLTEIRTPGGTSYLLDGQTNYLLVDCTIGAAYLITTSTDRVSDMFVSYGPPLTDLMIFKGHNSQFRILGQGNAGSARVWQKAWKFAVSIKGIYATVYPFAE